MRLKQSIVGLLAVAALVVAGQFAPSIGVAQDGKVIPQIATYPGAAPEARPPQRQHHEHEMAQVDGVELAQPAVISGPARRQVRRGRNRFGRSLDDSLAPRRSIAHKRPSWLDCTAKSFMLQCSIDDVGQSTQPRSQPPQ